MTISETYTFITALLSLRLSATLPLIVRHVFVLFCENRVTMIGCPKLDAVDYTEKLTQIFKYNDIRSVTVTRMTVPCCGGLPFAVKNAIENSGKDIPLQIVTISPDGRLIR